MSTCTDFNLIPVEGLKKEKKVQKEAELTRELVTRKCHRKHNVKTFYKESSSEEDRSKKKVGVSLVNPDPSDLPFQKCSGWWLLIFLLLFP